jgi:hypothetical protein
VRRPALLLCFVPRLPLGHYFSGIKFDKHRGIGFEIFYRNKEPKVVEEKEL